MKNRVKEERARLNLPQQELAERIGVSRQTVHSIENNRYVPSTVLALKIAAVFGKPVEELFQLEESDYQHRK
jgi:putative transcriptional regulator